MAEEATGWGGGLWAAADLVTPMAIRVAATLRLADHIAAGTQTTEALAAAVDADRDALGRLLGHLVTAGVLSRAGAGTYGLTALGEHLDPQAQRGTRPGAGDMNPYALNDVGIGSWPARRARMTPQRTALRFQGRSWTHGELYQRTEALSRALQRMGVHPGDRVAYLGNNHPAFLETLFAVGHLGAIFVPLNTRLSAAEIAYMLDDSGSAVLLVGAELAATAADAVGGGSPVRHIVLVDDEPTALPGALPYEQVLSEATDADPVDVAVGLDDPCMIIYTSGTTGRPKGAVITHGNVTWNAFNQLAHVDVLSDDVVLAVAPLFHTAGLNQVAIPALYKGSAVVLMPRMDAGDLLATIESERITAFSGVPTILQMIADHPAWDSSDLSSLRHVVYGGSPVSERVAKAWLDRGVMLLQGYGMTEASPGVFMAVADGAADRPVSIGVPHFFTDVAVLADWGPGQVSGAMAPGPRLAVRPSVRRLRGRLPLPHPGVETSIDTR
jgi:fatty-acyl-CoA synthase